MFLVQSYLGQEDGQTTMVDNVSMSSTEKVANGTNHTHITMDAPSKKKIGKE